MDDPYGLTQLHQGMQRNFNSLGRRKNVLHVIWILGTTEGKVFKTPFNKQGITKLCIMKSLILKSSNV